MVRSFILTRQGPAIGLYIVPIRNHMRSYLTPDVEKEVKDEIIRVGGTINRSGLFLSETATETVVTKKTGRNRSSVSFIPRSQVPRDLLQVLDKCKGPAYVDVC